ncbi:uncharacterized protein LOC117102059 [Anneissia japonica]|uniref:uncharacterized protein LOC117102059 n=1 Tax=Anneissia japonica TaxID=1529436 RepID=UPI0014256467|nr:uncharacterized protein LOC117102059 [Anneissia japonica]
MDDHSYSRAASRPKSIIFADQIFTELPPEDSAGSPRSKKPQLGHCGLIECQNKGHCRGWHCPLCHRTGPRYRVKNHVYSVHWASRVVVGGINSLLCKCRIPGKVTPRHWHCPYCACNPYYKLKYLVSHIVRTHKPNAIVKGYSQHRLAYSVDCTRSDADADLAADEHSFDKNDLRTDSWTPKRKALPKDFSFLGTHGCELVRCKEPGHCKGWHCSLCPAAAPKYRIRNHLATVHWASRIEIGDKVSVMCKCNKSPNSAPRHWHCPFCVIKCLRPKKMIRHIMDVHKPNEVVKRFSFGKPHGFFSRNDDGIQKVEEEEEVAPEPIKTPMPNCEVIRCIGQGHCKGWHCPYCSATGLRYLMKSHLQSVHWASRIEFDDKTSVLCKCNNFNKITPRHWHCPLCTDCLLYTSRCV